MQPRPPTDVPAEQATSSLEQTQQRVRHWATASISQALDLFFPVHCQACGAVTVGNPPARRGFCFDCEAGIRSTSNHSTGTVCCLRCAMPAPSRTMPPRDCPSCREQKWPFTETLALGPYRDLLRHLVLKSKHRHGAATARALGQLLATHHANRFAHLLENREAEVVPIPAHWTRRLSRGTNGPDAVAAGLAQALGLTCRSRLTRIRRTAKQVELAPSRRAENVRGAFQAKLPENASSKLILLVDDVFTTGATLSAAAKELVREGAEQVIVVVPAKRIDRL